jgi:hypothetical protein
VSDTSGSPAATSGRGHDSNMVANGGHPGSLAGPVPLWLQATLAIVIIGLLGLLVWLGFVLHDVFVSHKGNVVTLETAKGQLIVGAVTGVLTIAIASGTIWYARLTHSLVAQAEATRSNMQDQIRLASEQLSLSQMSLRLAMRPRLADVPAGWNRALATVAHLQLEGYGTPFALNDPGKVVLPPSNALFSYLVVPLRNIGTGPAVIMDGRLAVGDVVFDDYASSEVVVPANEVTNFVFAVPRDRPSTEPIVNALTRLEAIDVLVFYTNVQGDDASCTRLSLGKDPSGPQRMKVVRVQFEQDPSSLAIDGMPDLASTIAQVTQTDPDQMIPEIGEPSGLSQLGKLLKLHLPHW